MQLINLYRNPLSNDDFPDPSILKVEGLGYFAYATHDEFSPSINNVLYKQSKDLINWSESKGALVSPPVWGLVCNKFWCPHVVKVNNEYRMYYAAEPDTKDGMCLAMAVSGKPYDFMDCGAPISKLEGSTYQMIDPCFFTDPQTGKHLLYYGSAHEPIWVVELAQDGKTFISEPSIVLQPGEEKFQRLREGAFVTYHATWKRYFLWVSGDNTWEENGYAVSLFWSYEATGIFQKIPGKNIVLQANEYWDSPGHNCIIEDADSNEWIVYHAVDKKDAFIGYADPKRFLRKMCMDRIYYTTDGWPYIEAGSPSYSTQIGPVI